MTDVATAFYLGVTCGAILVSVGVFALVMTIYFVEENKKRKAIWDTKEKEMNERHARAKQTIEEMRQRMTV